MNHISDFFFEPYRNKETFIIILEAIVFVTGILSVWYAKKESILVYLPVSIMFLTQLLEQVSVNP